MIRLALLIIVSTALVAVMVLGYRGMRGTQPPLVVFDDMIDQQRYAPQGESPFFGDGRAARAPATRSAAWGADAQQPDQQFAADDAANFIRDHLPLSANRALLERGRALYDINCRVCHGGTGAGDGVTTSYGMINPPTYHQDRIRKLSDGQIYQIITQGKGQMAPYREKLRADDRWAVIAWLRVLQKAHNIPLDDPAVPDDVRCKLIQP